jgi:SIR2-like protein/TIR domain-containing protein
MPLEPRQWNNLLEALKNGSCVVLLGPSISTIDDGGLPLNHQFAKSLSKELDKEKIAYDKKHDTKLTYIMQRYITIPNVAPSDPGFEAKNFYTEHKGKFNGIQKALAELPINLVINTSPDDGMVTALKQAGKFNTIHAWYDYRKEQSQVFEIPSAEAPLVYNLIGHYENAMSLVLTETDQVEFMKSVIKDQPPIPPKLISQLDSHKTYLFLGFDWAEWNLRLLLEALNLEKSATILAHAHQDMSLEPMTRDFYESSFRFSFINEDIANFVNELKDKYATHTGASVPEVAQKTLYVVSTTKDEEFRSELCKNLKPLPLKIMHDGLIEAGEEIDATIKKGIEEADIILLLVSADFLASETILEKEWPIVLKRHQEKSSIVIPLVIRACNWEEWTDGELTKMSLILPRDGQQFKVFSSWEKPDEALSKIVDEIQKLI